MKLKKIQTIMLEPEHLLGGRRPDILKVSGGSFDTFSPEGLDFWWGDTPEVFAPSPLPLGRGPLEREEEHGFRLARSARGQRE
jgi:hypothetical protein